MKSVYLWANCLSLWLNWCDDNTFQRKMTYGKSSHWLYYSVNFRASFHPFDPSQSYISYHFVNSCCRYLSTSSVLHDVLFERNNFNAKYQQIWYMWILSSLSFALWRSGKWQKDFWNLTDIEMFCVIHKIEHNRKFRNKGFNRKVSSGYFVQLVVKSRNYTRKRVVVNKFCIGHDSFLGGVTETAQKGSVNLNSRLFIG